MTIWQKLRSTFGGGVPPEPHAKPATPQELFAAQVEEAIRERHPGAVVKRHPEAFGFLLKRGETDRSLFLDNIFAETRDVPPEERQRRIARFVASLDAPDASTMSWDEVRPKLASLLRSPSMFNNLPSNFQRDKGPISRPFVPFVVECVGVDSDDGIAYVTPAMVEKWGVEVEDVFETATQNGRAYFVDDIAPYDPQAPYPIWYVARDDSYESSRLAVPGWLASFAGKVTGGPVAIVPRRDLLIVGGDGDERCVRRLLESAIREYEASPRRISPTLYTVDRSGTVIPLKLDSKHPLAADVAIAHVKAAIAEYETQKEPLQKRLGDDVFVASCKGMKSDDGTVFTYAIWSKDVMTLLPRTDLVMLLVEPGIEGSEIIRVPWEKLGEIVGDCIIQELDVDPPRWRTLTWPSEAMLSRLRAD